MMTVTVTDPDTDPDSMFLNLIGNHVVTHFYANKAKSETAKI